jgi:hypothetical protein
VALAGIEMLAALSPAVRERVQVRQSAPAEPVATTIAAGTGASVHLGVSAVRRDFLSAQGVGAWGVRFDIDRELGARWSFGADLEGAFGRRSTDVGEASAMLVSVGGFFGLRGAHRRLTGGVSIGARGGLAMLAGTPADDSGIRGASVERPWWGPAVRARGAVDVGPLALVASLEAGVTARGAEGLSGQATALAVSGPWLAGAAGFWF